MKFVLSFLLLVLVGFLPAPVGAQSVDVYPGEFVTGQCVNDDTVAYTKNNKDFTLRIYSSSDFVKWEQNGEIFSVDYVKDKASRVFSGRIVVYLHRTRLKKNDEGRVVEQKGHYRFAVAGENRTTSEGGPKNFVRNLVHISDNEYIRSRVIDGKPSYDVRVVEDRETPGITKRVLYIDDYKGLELAKGLLAKRGVHTCEEQTVTRDAVMKGKFRGPMRRAIQKFERELGSVALAQADLDRCLIDGGDCSAVNAKVEKSIASRDSTWAKLIRAKDLLPYIAKPVPPRDGGDGGDDQTCSGSVWCSVFEHCINGRCVPKDAFNQCGPFNSCPLGESCVDGACQ